MCQLVPWSYDVYLSPSELALVASVGVVEMGRRKDGAPAKGVSQSCLVCMVQVIALANQLGQLYKGVLEVWGQVFC